MSMYDAVIVGARCAGAATAMLLSRQGHRVLMLDRDKFPSNKMSTHLMKRTGAACLKKWGLLEKLVGLGAPEITHWDYHYDDICVRGRPAPLHGIECDYATRRLELDQLLIEEAMKAGAEFQAQTGVRDLLWEDGRVVGVVTERHGKIQELRCRLVVGADGLQSTVAQKVGATKLVEEPTLNCGYYGYFSGLPTSPVLETHQFRQQRLLISFPTNAGLHVVFLFWPSYLAKGVRGNLEGTFYETLRLAPSLSEKVRGGRLEGRLSGTPLFQNFVRRSAGPGWVLAGDAAMHRDPITAYGMSHAFLDAELLARQIEIGFNTGCMDVALNRYDESRQELHRPSFEATVRAARMEPQKDWFDGVLRDANEAGEVTQDKLITSFDQEIYQAATIL